MTKDEKLPLRMKNFAALVLISSFALLRSLLRSSTRFAVLAVSLCSAVIRHSSFSAEPAAAAPSAFLQTYCIDCHGPDKQKGDRRFDHLSLPATKAEDLTDLQDIVDQLNLGDMPPKKAKQPPQGEREAVVASLTKNVSEVSAKLKSTG